MAKTIFDTSMSLDGFMIASHRTADELSMHLVPVLLGGGTRMFGDAPGQVDLEAVDVVSTASATRLRYRVLGRRESR